MEEIVCEVDEKKVNSIVKGILENTKKIHDCVIYDENNEVSNEINFYKIISMYYDLTGFEMFCNEILFLNNEIVIHEYDAFVNALKRALNQMYNEPFVVYLYHTFDVDGIWDGVAIRFHIFRSDEGYYYNPEDNFEEIDEPIMCCL